MIYLMEDKADDMLCKLFKSAYKSNISKNFIYTNGNGILEFNCPFIFTKRKEQDHAT